jgi:hypothetical protein
LLQKCQKNSGKKKTGQYLVELPAKSVLNFFKKNCFGNLATKRPHPKTLIFRHIGKYIYKSPSGENSPKKKKLYFSNGDGDGFGTRV